MKSANFPEITQGGTSCYIWRKNLSRFLVSWDLLQSGLTYDPLILAGDYDITISRILDSQASKLSISVESRLPLMGTSSTTTWPTNPQNTPYWCNLLQMIYKLFIPVFGVNLTLGIGQFYTPPLARLLPSTHRNFGSDHQFHRPLSRISDMVYHAIPNSDRETSSEHGS